MKLVLPPMVSFLIHICVNDSCANSKILSAKRIQVFKIRCESNRILFKYFLNTANLYYICHILQNMVRNDKIY